MLLRPSVLAPPPQGTRICTFYPKLSPTFYKLSIGTHIVGAVGHNSKMGCTVSVFLIRLFVNCWMPEHLGKDIWTLERLAKETSWPLLILHSNYNQALVCVLDVKAKEFAQGKPLCQEPKSFNNVLTLAMFWICIKTTRTLFWPCIYLSILWKEVVYVLISLDMPLSNSNGYSRVQKFLRRRRAVSH